MPPSHFPTEHRAMRIYDVCYTVCCLANNQACDRTTPASATHAETENNPCHTSANNADWAISCACGYAVVTYHCWKDQMPVDNRKAECHNHPYRQDSEANTYRYPTYRWVIPSVSQVKAHLAETRRVGHPTAKSKIMHGRTVTILPAVFWKEWRHHRNQSYSHSSCYH